eukprot:2388294-Pyramimonas_sp.AAC.1
MVSRGPRFRWTPQEPTKVATVVQFAVNGGAARSQMDSRGLLWLILAQALSDPLTLIEFSLESNVRWERYRNGVDRFALRFEDPMLEAGFVKGNKARLSHH